MTWCALANLRLAPRLSERSRRPSRQFHLVAVRSLPCVARRPLCTALSQCTAVCGVGFCARMINRPLHRIAPPHVSYPVHCYPSASLDPHRNSCGGVQCGAAVIYIYTSPARGVLTVFGESGGATGPGHLVCNPLAGAPVVLGCVCCGVRETGKKYPQACRYPFAFLCWKKEACGTYECEASFPSVATQPHETGCWRSLEEVNCSR